MEAARRAYYDKYLAQPGGQTTARNMYDDIVQALRL
jgi:hypothetical protein